MDFVWTIFLSKNEPLISAYTLIFTFLDSQDEGSRFWFSLKRKIYESSKHSGNK